MFNELLLRFCTAFVFTCSLSLSIANANDSPMDSNSLNTTTQHGFALYGDLKYPENFKHFNYVNPEANKGGQLKLMGFGSYDSLNPYTLKGVSPFNTPGQFIFGFSELNETLLVGTGDYSPSGDEPQSAYGLIAETLTYPEDYKWVRFTLRKQARFHDGHPMDANDVAFSYDTLINKGHPRYQQSLLGIEHVRAISPSIVHVEFKDANQAANILRIGEMPVLPEHYWQDKDFEKSTQIPPLLSGPYEISDYKMGSSITFKRKPEAWSNHINGATLNIYKGRYNFDQVTIDYYRDQTVAFEAFKAGEFDLFFDYTAKNWAMAYDFPALQSGKVLKEEIAHSIPSTTQAFYFNTRKAIFKDSRVREALSLMFDFEWTNKTLFNDAYQRNVSYFPNSDFSASDIPTKEERDLLTTYKQQLSPALFDKPYVQSVTAGNGKLRRQTRQAIALLKLAGWELKDHQLTNVNSGKVFTFEILSRQAGIQRVLLPFIKNLEKLGIKAEARLVDTTQYKTRLDQFDYDMTTVSLGQGNAPSYEQRDYFHSSNSSIEGSQNYAGIESPVVDALINKVLKARKREELVHAMRALDRVLLWEHYTIPNWHLSFHRLASWNKFSRPTVATPYKLGIENWWQEPKQ